MQAQDQELARLETERAKHETVQERIYRELELYKGRFLEAQKALLVVVEAMTTLCITEEQLQQGSSSKDAVVQAGHLTEERVITDLQRLAQRTGAKTATTTVPNALGHCLETRALQELGLQRVGQLQQICARYEGQLLRSEVELSRALHSTYVICLGVVRCLSMGMDRMTPLLLCCQTLE
ncbi:hypothetical protein PINS_up002875 [Pythium insidiosum]|nr:hypothetical protein PINS_up002875 [Pythium insidiosum]